MNTLLEKSARMPFHTDLRLVLQALGGRQREFNWLLTDCEVNPCPPGLRNCAVSRADACWLTGRELTAMVETHEMQFAWAVLSGFDRGVEMDLARLEPYPYADGNEGLWVPGVQIQHPLAEVEIVCWDSGATLLLSRDDDLTRRFRAFFPEAVDLDEHNRLTARRGTGPAV